MQNSTQKASTPLQYLPNFSPNNTNQQQTQIKLQHISVKQLYLFSLIRMHLCN